MTQGPRLMLWTFALSAAAVWAMGSEAPAFAHQAPGRTSPPAVRDVPATATHAGRQGESGPAPEEKQTPPPAEPTGCPFRNGKLELIA